MKNSEGTIIGATSLRHYLNYTNIVDGGHIAYGICPEFRGHGYGSLILKLALDKIKEMNIFDALITCDSDNIGSQKVILHNCGVLENETVDEDGVPIHRYWIHLKERPVTTLFMLSSLDGKISTGDSDELDFDKDIPNIDVVNEGLHQYYEIEQTTDLWSLNSGRVQAKMGANEKSYPAKTPVSFVIIDNTHLNEHGIRYFCARSKNFVLVTSNKNHPAFSVNEDNLHIILQKQLNLREMLEELNSKFNCQRITVQTGGTLNGMFLRERLFDYVDIVVAPLLVGGKETSSLIDGLSLTKALDLDKLGILKLEKCEVLKNSYIRLKYKVIH